MTDAIVYTDQYRFIPLSDCDVENCGDVECCSWFRVDKNVEEHAATAALLAENVSSHKINQHHSIHLFRLERPAKNRDGEEYELRLGADYFCYHKSPEKSYLLVSEEFVDRRKRNA